MKTYFSRILAFTMILLVIFTTSSVLASETSVPTHTPAYFIGFDDGVVPSNLVKNSNVVIAAEKTAFVNNGIYSADCTNADPYFTFTHEFIYGDYKELRFRMKHTSPETASSCKTQVFFKGTMKDGTPFEFNGSYSILQTIAISTDDFVEYRVPLNTLEALKGATITHMRFDVINTQGSFDIDYFMLVPHTVNTDMVFTFNSDVAPWTVNLASRFASFEAKNGNAVAVTADTGAAIQTNLSYFGGDYPKAYVRMMIDKEIPDGATGDDAIPGIPAGTKKSLFYTNLVDVNGESIKGVYSQYNGYSYADAVISSTDNQQYKVYTYDFSKYPVYMNNFVTQVSFNMVQVKGVRVNVDTILFKNPKSFEWDFECKDLFEGWIASDSCFTVSDGKLKYTENDTTYSNPRIELKDIAISGDDYVGLELVMKHSIIDEASNSSNMTLYYTGTDIEGTEFKISENYTGRVNITDKSSGDNYRYYYIDLTSSKNWAGSNINYLRFDPINSLGNVEIEYLKLVPATLFEPLDPSKVTLEYNFLNEEKGSADGTITVNFGEQSLTNAKRVNIVWASGNDTDGYTQLPDYTVLFSGDGTEFSHSYILNKNLLIPETATALMAKITDSEKTFEVIFKIPDSKLPGNYGTPVYTAAYASDFHLGRTLKDTGPNVCQSAARTDILASDADFLVAIGDITQWYGEISNLKQWEITTEYFKEFDIPVYMVKGNHDEPNFPTTYVKDKGWESFTFDYYDEYLDNWIKYSADNGFYNVERVGENLDWYDAYINGHHYIFTSIPDKGYYSFGDEQLDWLEMKLFEAEESGKPIFVFGHVPANGKLNYQSQTGAGSIGDFKRFEAILNRHPTAIYSSGDSHYTLDSILPNTVDGKQITPSYINDGAVIEAYKAADENVVNSPRIAVAGNNAHGLYAEVYDNMMITRARDFINGKYISLGLSKVTFKDNCEIPEFSVTGESDNGNVNIAITNPAENITYTWYIDGEETGISGTSLSVSDKFAGYIAIRATDTNGNYRSELFETIADIDGVVLEKPVSKIRITDVVYPLNTETGKIIINESTPEKAEIYFTANSALENKILYIGYYDNSSKLSAAKIITIDSNTASAGIVNDTYNIYGLSYMKVLLLDNTTLEPICKPFTKRFK